MTPNVPRVGTELAGYRIDELLDRGGMGVVYLAEHIRLGRKVAFKVLSAELADDDRFRERFLRESRIASSLNHPNVVPIFDAGEADGVLFLAMQYIPRTLEGVIKQEGALEPQRVLSIVAQVASALDAAHANGLIHRDVKPANILMTGSAATLDQVYLADFGLTKRSESQAGSSLTGQFVGTVDYVAPEQIEGKDVDSRVDVYSLGCLLYQCLTATPPFNKDNEVAVLWAHLREDPPKVSTRIPELPAAIDEVVAKAMAKSPDDRYPTCADLVSAARVALSAPATHADPAVVRTEPRAVSAPGVTKDKGASSQPATEKRRRSRLWRAAWIILAFIAGGVAGWASHVEFGWRFSSPPEGDPGMQLVSVDQLLYELIPSDIAVHCGPGRNPSGAFVATFECRLSHGITVTYSFAHSGDDLRSFYAERLKTSNVHGDSGGCKENLAVASGSGSSPTTYSGEGVWYRVLSRRHSTKPPSNRAQPSGRVFCYTNGTRFGLDWTDDSLHIYSSALIAPRDPDFLIDWWANDAGPWNPKVVGSTGQ